DGDGCWCESCGHACAVEGAGAAAGYEAGWLSGRPAVPRNGSAWYVGTRLDAAAMDALVRKLAEESDVAPPLAAPPGLEVVRREGEGQSFLFLLNHGAQEAKVEVGGTYRDVLTDDECTGAMTLEPFG